MSRLEAAAAELTRSSLMTRQTISCSRAFSARPSSARAPLALGQARGNPTSPGGIDPGLFTRAVDL